MIGEDGQMASGQQLTRTGRHVLFWAVAAAYVALTLLVVFGWGPLMHLDQTIDGWHLRRRWPAGHRFVLDYVMFGQRGPATFAMLPVFVWLCRRRRTIRPVVTLVTGLLVLNLSVGVVKIATGRLGPAHTHIVHDVFAGGMIYPSGHTSNAVVLYGILAVVVSARWRPWVVAATWWIAGSVGVSTLYLGTHWLSDVIGGWLAGALVLLVLPRADAIAWRFASRAEARLRARWARWAARRQPPPAPAAGLVAVGSAQHPAGAVSTRS